jgi:hypothetical protein
MPQTILPLFTEEMTLLNHRVGVVKCEGMVYYFQGAFPFYHHREDDRECFKHIVCQLISNGMASRAEIVRALRIPARSISRWLAVFKKEGEAFFFSKACRFP